VHFLPGALGHAIFERCHLKPLAFPSIAGCFTDVILLYVFCTSQKSPRGRAFASLRGSKCAKRFSF
jgi:hypothetical protein